MYESAIASIKRGQGGGEGKDLPKIESLGLGRHKILCEKAGTNPGGGRVDVEMGELPLFYFLYSSITFTLCEGKVRFPCFYFLNLQSFDRVSHARFSSNSLLY